MQQQQVVVGVEEEESEKARESARERQRPERIRKAVEDPDQSTSSPLVPMC